MTVKTAYALLVDIYKANPNATDDALFEVFYEDGKQVMRQVARAWFIGTIAVIRRAARPKCKPSDSRIAAATVLAQASGIVHGIRSKAQQEVKSMLDTIVLRDGRRLGDVQWYELEVLARENEHEARILRAVKAHLRVNDDQVSVRSVISDRAMAAICRDVEGILAA